MKVELTIQSGCLNCVGNYGMGHTPKYETKNHVYDLTKKDEVVRLIELMQTYPTIISWKVLV